MAEKHFSQMWDQWIKHTSRSQGPRQLWKTQEKILKTNFAQMREIQLSILKRLAACVNEDEALVDIFGGKGLATIPLVRAKLIRALTIIDDGKSPGEQNTGKIFSNTSPDEITHTEATIHRWNAGRIIPRDTLVLAETGLGLPEENRMPPGHQPIFNVRPEDYRSGHIINPNVNIGDIAQEWHEVTGGQRHLHIIDTPFYKKPMTPEQIQDYVQGWVSPIVCWEHEETKQINRHGTTHISFRRV